MAGYKGIDEFIYDIDDPNLRSRVLDVHKWLQMRIWLAERNLQFMNLHIGWHKTIMGTVRISYDKRIKTACVTFDPNTGQVVMYFDAFFIQDLSSGDISYILAHEVMHYAYDHLERSKKKHKEIWNWATDIYINEYLDSNLEWNEMSVSRAERQDFTLDRILRWDCLPDGVKEKLPYENFDNYDADIIYYAIIEWCKENEIPPDEFNNLLKGKIKDFGKVVEKDENGNEVPPEQPASRKTIRKPVLISYGDVVFVKSERRYGIVKGRDPVSNKAYFEAMKANKKPLPPAPWIDIDFDSRFTAYDYVGIAKFTWNNQAKSYEATKEYMERYLIDKNNRFGPNDPEPVINPSDVAKIPSVNIPKKGGRKKKKGAKEVVFQSSGGVSDFVKGTFKAGGI